MDNGGCPWSRLTRDLVESPSTEIKKKKNNTLTTNELNWKNS